MDYRDREAGQPSSGFWFRAKRDLIRRMLEQYLPRRNGRRPRILNSGSGTGEDAAMVAAFGETYCIDIDRNALRLTDDRFCAGKRVADAQQLPYADGFFDAVIAADLFEHVDDDAKAVSEAYRVLKVGGLLVMTVPAFPSLFGSHDRALGHRRRYRMREVCRLCGIFSKRRFTYWNCLLFIPIAVCRLFRKNAKPKIDDQQLPDIVSRLLYGVMCLENRLIVRGVPLPWGLSIAGHCRK